jgi:hypothetical protein
MLDGDSWIAWNSAFGVMMLGAGATVFTWALPRWMGWLAIALGVLLFIPFADFFALLVTMIERARRADGDFHRSKYRAAAARPTLRDIARNAEPLYADLMAWFEPAGNDPSRPLHAREARSGGDRDGFASNPLSLSLTPCPVERPCSGTGPAERAALPALSMPGEGLEPSRPLWGHLILSQARMTNFATPAGEE